MEKSLRIQQGMTMASVIAVLAIVVALVLVLPLMFSCGCGSRPRARQISCASNEKQLGLALLQYEQDNDERLPVGTQTTPGLGWAGQVYPYVKSVGVFRCPEDEGLVGKAPISYAYNANVPSWLTSKKNSLATFGDPPHSVMLFEVSGVEIQTASDGSGQTIALDEGAGQGARTFSAAGDGTAGNLHSTLAGPDPVHYATGDLGGRPRSTPDQFSAQGRHRGQSNFLFADGHVKTLAPEQVSTGGNAPAPSAGQAGTTAGTAAGTGDRAFVGTLSLR